jgi:hypothetical protein
MFVGVIVLCTFGAAALACAVLAIRGAMQRNWAVFGALLLPAVGIGGTIIMMVGPVIKVWLFGDPHLEVLTASAQKMDAAGISEVYTNQEHFGLGYNEDDHTFYWFDQSVDEGGGFKGVEQDGSTFAGGWEVLENQVCYNVSNTLTCYDVYNLGDEYAEVNHRMEIVNRFRLLPEPMMSPEGSVALTDATLNAIVPGHTLSGMLQLYYVNPEYSASFAADSVSVTVTRGDDTETGTYRIEDDKLCLAGVVYLEDSCLVVYPSPNGFDMVRSNGRVVMTVSTLE